MLLPIHGCDFAPTLGTSVWASAWLWAIAAYLVLAGVYDVAVRDVVIAIAAFTLARDLRVNS